MTEHRLTAAHKVTLAVVLVASLLLVGGYITSDHWLPVVQGVVVAT